MKSHSKSRKWMVGLGVLGLALAMSGSAPWTAPVFADDNGNHGIGLGNNGHQDLDDPGDYLSAFPGDFLGNFGGVEPAGNFPQLTTTQRAALRQARLTRDAAILAALQTYLTAEQQILGGNGAPLTTAQQTALLQARQARDTAIAAAQRTYRQTVQAILNVHPVSLTAATANANTNLVTLTFNRGLNATSAATAGNFTVTVNGTAVTVQSAAYNAATRQVTLTLPAGTLHSGDHVTVNWNGLQDLGGNTVTGSTTITVPVPPAAVAITTAAASVPRNAVAVFFNGRLNADSANTAANFTLTVNGTPVAVQSSVYTSSLRMVVLSLPAGSLQSGDVVTVTPHGLLDANGSAVTGSATFTIPPATTNVTMSSGTASVANSLVNLRFTGPLNSTTASNAANFTVTVNGTPVTVESAGYNSTLRQITLGLPVGSLVAGDHVVVSWSGLQDIHGTAVTGTTTLTAR